MKRSIWTDDYSCLRKALKSMRIEEKLSQLQLVNLLDKPRIYVTKYKKADRNLDFLEVVCVCKACHVDPVVFMESILKAIKGS